MAMSMPMQPVDRAAGGGPYGWSRMVIRSSRALALELFMVVVILGWRRFRQQGWAGI
jgi:hypothetical protein